LCGDSPFMASCDPNACRQSRQPHGRRAARLRNRGKSLRRRRLSRKNRLVEITTLWPGARNELRIGRCPAIFRVRSGVTWAWTLLSRGNLHFRDANRGSGFWLQWFEDLRGSRAHGFQG
jgi:hypothetical protein